MTQCHFERLLALYKSDAIVLPVSRMARGPIVLNQKTNSCTLG